MTNYILTIDDKHLDKEYIKSRIEYDCKHSNIIYERFL